jgi:Fibronectin type III domain
MATSKLPIIRASSKYNKLNDNDFRARLNAVLSGTFDNSKFPAPPVDKATFSSGLETYGVLIGDALDGSKKAIAAREKQRTTMAMMMRLLAHYVENTSNGNMDVFMSSGFEPAITTRSAPQPLAQPTIKAIDQGNSGELVVTVAPVNKTRSYEIRYGTSSSAPSTWALKVVPSVKQPVTFDGLTAGTSYSFQVRAFGKLGYTDFSAPLSRMCI